MAEQSIPDFPHTSYPAWALAAFNSHIAPVLLASAGQESTERMWIETCGPGDSLVTRFRLFPGALYLLWVRALGGPLGAGNKQVAAALECLHNASLHHDDALDHHDSRRGVVTLRAKAGAPASILAGDGLVGVAWRLLSAVQDFDVRPLLTLLADAWTSMTLGQCMDEPDAWETLPRARYSLHWQSMARKKLSLGDIPGPLAAVSLGRLALVEPLARLHAEFSVCSQIINDIGDIEGWAGFHAVGPCQRTPAEEASRKPTFVAILEGMAIEPKRGPISSSARQGAREEIRRLTSLALERLGKFDISENCRPILADFFKKPLEEFERVQRQNNADA